MAEEVDGLQWFGVRCHFLHPRYRTRAGQIFEERITVWRADSFDDAIAKAEAETVTYAEDVEAEYLQACSSYRLGVGGFGLDGHEVFSEMRRSDLSPQAYLDRFFFTGGENTTDRGVARP